MRGSFQLAGLCRVAQAKPHVQAQAAKSARHSTTSSQRKPWLVPSVSLHARTTPSVK